MRTHSPDAVSIIMPAYNPERTLAAAVNSVLAQSHTDWELIIIDDCSSDGTLKLAQLFAARDGRIRVISNGENSGAAAARHRGACAARHAWLAFLDSDDVWLPEKLERQLCLQLRSRADLIYTGSAFMDADGHMLDWTLHVPEKITYRRLLHQNIISNSSVLIRRDCYLRHAVKDSGMHEDFACWLGALRAGLSARGIDRPLIVYRLSGCSKSGNKLRSAKMNWNTYRALGLSFGKAICCMAFYTANGLRKYRHLRRKGAIHEDLFHQSSLQA